MTCEPKFAFICCQPGAEAALKHDLAAEEPRWRFAFSRPGFLTFKWADTSPAPEKVQFRSVLARTFGWSLGTVQQEQLEQRIAHVADQFAPLGITVLHVWQRQSRAPTSAMPKIWTPDSEAIGAALGTQLVERGILPATSQVNALAPRGAVVGDVVVMEPDRWCLGWHVANAFGQRWSGGVPQLEVPQPMISRAYLKLREGLMWGEVPFESGDRVIDLGSAPGGASQALLEMGARVLGVDPAEMHPTVMNHPNFIHLRKRGSEVQRRLYRGYRWLVADANVAPKHTLDTVESIVMHEATHLQGLLLTLKLSDWRMVAALGEHIQRIQSWGFESVRCRHLASNHQEICVAALRERSLRRRA